MLLGRRMLRIASGAGGACLDALQAIEVLVEAPVGCRVTVNRSKRLALLLVCCLAGLAIGVAGASFTGSSVWYVALPAAVAVGWLFVADPTRCEPPAQRRNESAGRDRDAPAARDRADDGRRPRP